MISDENILTFLYFLFFIFFLFVHLSYSFNNISTNFDKEKKRDALTISHFMRKDYF